MMNEQTAAVSVSGIRWPLLLGGAVGNLIEWYDWTIYGLLSVVFAPQIVPAQNPATSLIGVLLAYAVGFLMRPIGSIVLSPMADKYGRRRMLSLSIILMGAGSLIVAVTPPFAAVGIVRRSCCWWRGCCKASRPAASSRVPRCIWSSMPRRKAGLLRHRRRWCRSAPRSCWRPRPRRWSPG